MSFFDYLFDTDWRQRSDIEELKAKARRQQRLANRSSLQSNTMIRTLENKIEDLEEEIGALQLLTRAMLIKLKTTDFWDDSLYHKILLDMGPNTGDEPDAIITPT